MDRSARIACATDRRADTARFLRISAASLLCIALVALAGCGAPPAGANDPDTHPGAALVPGGGAGPGLHGPYHTGPGEISS